MILLFLYFKFTQNVYAFECTAALLPKLLITITSRMFCCNTKTTQTHISRGAKRILSPTESYKIVNGVVITHTTSIYFLCSASRMPKQKPTKSETLSKRSYHTSSISLSLYAVRRIQVLCAKGNTLQQSTTPTTSTQLDCRDFAWLKDSLVLAYYSNALCIVSRKQTRSTRSKEESHSFF